MTSTPLPEPLVDADNRPYWEAAREGRLLLQRCSDCGTPRFYPRHACPACWSDRTEWIEASGRGTIHAVTTVRRAPTAAFRERAPYVVAMIDLGEGPRILTNVVGPGAEAARIGQRVELVFEKRGDSAVPQFRLAGDERP